MSTAAGWYDDPTRSGRLRYWDGSIWTEWVSSDGQTTSDPLPTAGAPVAQVAAATPAAEVAFAATPVQATPGLAAAPAFRTAGVGAAMKNTGVSMLTRIGFGLAALAGIISCFAAGREASTNGLQTYSFGNDVIGIGIVIALIAAAGAVVPWLWGRVAAVGLTAGGIGFLLLIGIGGRSSGDFVSGVDVEVKSGLVIIIIAALIGIVAIALALLGMRPSAGIDPSGGPASTSKPVVSLVLSIAGVLFFPLAAAGAALGFGGLDDIRASGGRLGNRGLAVAGVVVGLVALSLWVIGLTIGMFVARP